MCRKLGVSISFGELLTIVNVANHKRLVKKTVRLDLDRFLFAGPLGNFIADAK